MKKWNLIKFNINYNNNKKSAKTKVQFQQQD